MPKISAIYQGLSAEDAEQAIDALVAQGYPNFEIVLVDAEHEKNHARIREYAADRFVAVRHVGVQQKAGIEISMDAGVVGSLGKILAFCEHGQSPDLKAIDKIYDIDGRHCAAIDGVYTALRATAIAACGDRLERYKVAELDPSGRPNPRGALYKERTAKLRRIVMIYGEFSSYGHGPYVMDGLYQKMGLTGSEGSFFNLARSLAERGHEVAVFCDVAAPSHHESGFDAVPISSIGRLAQLEGIDNVIAWNEPDYLQYAPAGAKRLCDQQLNDFGYCRVPGWEKLADVWVSPSENHKQNVMGGLSSVVVIPNSVDLGLYGPEPTVGNHQWIAPVRDPHRVVYCSSPDRGLHHLLSAWPLVRKREPNAELKIFYKLGPWIERCLGMDDESGRRARYIAEALPKLRGFGVEVVDLVPSARMARELESAAVLAYPCDPVRYTEGFGCSVLDACAAGCLPLISGADALPSVHGSAAIIPTASPPDREGWATAISLFLASPATGDQIDRMRAHAFKHSRERVAEQWEALLAAL